MKIDKQKAVNGGYTGPVSESGFPLIDVSYRWRMCNENQGVDEFINLKPNLTFAKLRKAKQSGLNNTGVMRPSKCRSLEKQSVMNTEKR